MNDVVVQPAKIDNLDSIVEIYNEVVKEEGYTADLRPLGRAERLDWFAKTNVMPYGISVLIRDNSVIGYFYFSPWRGGREAVKTTAELSFYLSKESRGRGLGDLIMRHALDQAQERGFKHLLAILLDCNQRSELLLAKWGFNVAGRLPRVANLKEKVVGQLIMLQSFPEVD